MNKKLRQEILKEIKILLNEEEVVDYSQAKSGGSYGSGATGRILGTTAAVGGAALATTFPVVGIAALVLGAAYLAFRTAGWKEVAEDISEANIVKDDEVAKKLSTRQYLDLTTMEDATDEADMKSFMAAMKGMADAYKETETLEEYQNFLKDAQAQKTRLDKVCNNFVLLNEFGQNDRMYFVKCAKVTAYQPATPQSKCVKVEGIQIPAVLYNVELENEISDSQKTFRAPAGEVSAIICPLIEKLCGTGEQPAPSPTPAPEGQVGGQGKNSFKCPNQQDVAVFQQWLGVKEDCYIGVKTIKAAQAKGLKLNLQDYFNTGELTPEQKQNQITLCNSLKTNRAGYEAEIKKTGQEVRGKCLAAGSGGSGGKKKPKIPPAVPPADPPADPAADPAAIANESKNFFHNKKMKEARVLYERLLKRLR